MRQRIHLCVLQWRGRRTLFLVFVIGLIVTRQQILIKQCVIILDSLASYRLVNMASNFDCCETSLVKLNNNRMHGLFSLQIHVNKSHAQRACGMSTARLRLSDWPEDLPVTASRTEL